jgi:hypothetical protein
MRRLVVSVGETFNTDIITRLYTAERSLNNPTGPQLVSFVVHRRQAIHTYSMSLFHFPRLTFLLRDDFNNTLCEVDC